MAIKEIKREWSPEQLDYVKHYLLHYERDVKDLPKCCVGSRATVSETDNEYVCAECGWIRAEYVELATICPEILSDPDVEIYCDPEKTEIAEREYWDDHSMEIAYFPNVEQVGMFAFRKASYSQNENHRLKMVILPKAKTIGRQAFHYNTKLEYIYAPQVEELETPCVHCDSLRVADFQNLKKLVIGYGMGFGNNYNLTTVNMPMLEEINDSSLFANCTSLANVYFPKLSTIGSSGMRAFEGCTALKRGDFPMLQNVGSGMFYRCSALETVILRNETMVSLDDTRAFVGTLIASGTGYIYVPAALIEDYKVATNWSTYAAQFRAIEDYPEICGTDLDETITKGEAMALVNEKVGGNVCTINVTVDDWGEDLGNAMYQCTPTADKTFDEINAAYKAGKTMRVAMVSEEGVLIILPLVSIVDDVMFQFGMSLMGEGYLCGFQADGVIAAVKQQ